MKNIKRYAYPSTVKEALSVLLNKRYKAMALAGGTLVAKTLPDTVETYLDLKNLPIRGIRLAGGNLVIGSGATFDEIDRSRLCRSWAGGVIARAAARCSSQLIRNMATIGGNVARPHSFNIFPVLLLGLDARVRLHSKAGARLVEFQDLYSSGLGLRPGLDSLITEVVVPAKTRKWKCEFIKLAKTESSWESYITLLFCAETRGRAAAQARVAVGALSPRPFRAPEAESALLSGAGAAAAAKTFAGELEAARAGEYRSSAAASLFKRFVVSIRGTVMKNNAITAAKGLFDITVTINGALLELAVKNGEFLLDALRRHGWKGAKKGCDTGDCGSCAVILNGRPVLGCLTPAVTAHLGELTTIEGLGTVHKPHPLQQAFVEAGAVQCGFCIPGMILSAKHLLDRTPAPTEAQIRKALDGNLCRCTGYVKQVEAVRNAAKPAARRAERARAA